MDFLSIRNGIASIWSGMATITLFPRPFTYEDVQREVDDIQHEVDEIQQKTVEQCDKENVEILDNLVNSFSRWEKLSKRNKK